MTGNQDQILDMSATALFSDYIYDDINVRRCFAQATHEHLMEEVNSNSINIIPPYILYKIIQVNEVLKNNDSSHWLPERDAMSYEL